MNDYAENFDFDYLVIGSGFGGSISAMRLAQKGYSVGIIEAGKRFGKDDFAKSNWNFKKYLWFPKIFCYGIQKTTLLNNVFIMGSAGVGGGSLNYANTLYVPGESFFKNDTIKKIGGKKGLLPFFKLTEKMLGVTENPVLTEADKLMKETAAEFGRDHTFKLTPVGVYFGEPEKTVKDPYFLGEGPERTGCALCGGCMVGCRFEGKNTLDKNYLYFAEKFGAEVIAERKVVDIIPHSDNGSEGYTVKTTKTTGLFGYPKKSFTAKGIVVAGGVIGTLSLLLKMKQEKKLPHLSEMLGRGVRTNSESMLAVKQFRMNGVDHTYGVAISSSVFPDEHTHIEPVRFSKHSGAIQALGGVITDGGGKIPRQLRFVLNMIKHPLHFLNLINPYHAAERGICLLVMQDHDNSIDIQRKRRIIWPFIKSLTSKQSDDKKIPTYIPIANEFARKLAKRTKGSAYSTINEILLNAPTTAHILSGCPMGETPETGVIDLKNRVFGYENMYVIDGSMIPTNLGVNPSLTISAFAERANSFIAPKNGKDFKFLKVEGKWKVKDLLAPQGQS